MLLVVDVRNSDTEIGLVDDGAIVGKWEVRTSDRTRDERVPLSHSRVRRSADECDSGQCGS
jgi:pantothenate kinase type III